MESKTLELSKNEVKYLNRILEEFVEMKTGADAPDIADLSAKDHLALYHAKNIQEKLCVDEAAS